MEIDGIPKLSPDQPELYCEKCNITFKKLEVFKVHKENYCESRHANVEAIQAARAEKQREREEMKLVNKERTKVRSLENDDDSQREYSQKPYPCHDCKIGFESKKHYEAHKRNYCPTRNTDSPDSTSSNNGNNDLLRNSAQSALLNALLTQQGPMIPTINPLVPNTALTSVLAALTNLGQLSAMNQTKTSMDQLKAQILIKNLETTPLDLSSKKPEGSDETIQPDFQAVKIEEIDSDCGDTRVSV